MAEAFVKTLKRDYVRVSPIGDAAAALTLKSIAGWRTTTLFTRTPGWAIAHRENTSMLNPNPPRVRSDRVNSTSGSGTLAGRAAQRSAIVVGFSAPERVLAEFARVLTPKGRVALSWWDGVGRLGGAEVCEPAQISLPVGGSESCLTRRCARLLQKPARGGYWQQ
jgi:hypothetical protein